MTPVRRAVLAAPALAVTGALLAACSSSGADSPTVDDVRQRRPRPRTPASPT